MSNSNSAQHADVVLAALEAAYIKFGDFRFNWYGRNTLNGQELLSQMRDAIAKATDQDPCAVQDDYGTRAARREQAEREARSANAVWG